MQKQRAKQGGMLLKVLEATFAPMSKKKLKNLLKFGAVTVNGGVIRQFNHPVVPGDELVLMDKGIGSAKSKFELWFPLVYEDEDIIVIDKPEGLLTMGTDAERRKTAYWKLGEYMKNKGAAHKSIYIVHRLDRDASGLLVFAKTEEAKYALQQNWDKVQKRYYAVVEGAPEKDQDTVESYLMEDKFNRVFSTRQSPKSQKAVTEYRVVAKKGPLSLVDITLITGRKNQIRVHMKDLGCPLIGDAKYGCKIDPAGRLGLHAAYLAFPHPITGKRMEFKSDLPAPLKNTFFNADKLKIDPRKAFRAKERPVDDDEDDDSFDEAPQRRSRPTPNWPTPKGKYAAPAAHKPAARSFRPKQRPGK